MIWALSYECGRFYLYTIYLFSLFDQVSLWLLQAFGVNQEINKLFYTSDHFIESCWLGLCALVLVFPDLENMTKIFLTLIGK